MAPPYHCPSAAPLIDSALQISHLLGLHCRFFNWTEYNLYHPSVMLMYYNYSSNYYSLLCTTEQLIAYILASQSTTGNTEEATFFSCEIYLLFVKTNTRSEKDNNQVLT